MNCPNCGFKNVDSMRFCPECGENIEKLRASLKPVCPECGTECVSGAKFCFNCGYRFNTAAAAAGDLGFASFGGFDLDALSREADGLSAEAAEKKRLAALEMFEYISQGNGTYAITGLKTRTLLNAVIPEGVISVGEGVFEGSEVFSVSLPDGLLQIGARAFKDCKNLSVINLPSSLMLIGDEAFYGCEILDIELPSTLKRVGRDAIVGTVGYKRQQDIIHATVTEPDTDSTNSTSTTPSADDVFAEFDRLASEYAQKHEDRSDYDPDEIDAIIARLMDPESPQFVNGKLTFGSYPQNNERDPEPIEWDILAYDDDRRLLVSKYILDYKRYDTAGGAVNWTKSDLRQWLNDYFLHTAFSDNQCEYIADTVTLDGRSIAIDKVFICSATQINECDIRLNSPDEVTAYFYAPESTKVAMDHARLFSARIGDAWLRQESDKLDDRAPTLKKIDNDRSYINRFGEPTNTSLGVRPAIWVKH